MWKLQRGLFTCIYNSEPIKLEEVENYPAHWCVEVFSDDGDYGNSENEKHCLVEDTMTQPSRMTSRRMTSRMTLCAPDEVR